MNSLLDKQHISPRKSCGARGKTPGKNRGAGHFRKASSGFAKTSSPYEHNAWVIDNIAQKPARPHRQKRYGFREKSFSFPNLRKIAASFTGSGASRTADEKRHDSPPADRGFSSFAVPAIPAAALVLLALGMFFAKYNQAGTMDWMDREVVKTGKDEGSEYNLALYAGVNSAEKKRADEDAIPLDLSEAFAWHSYKVKKGDSVSKIAADFSVSMDAIIASNGITNARSLREGEVLRIPNMDGIPYTIRSGDSLSGISKSMGVPLEAILDANDLQDDRINAGMNLFIPGARMNREDLKMALGELFIYPLRGARLSSPFGWRNDPFSGARTYHAAIDLSAPQGTPIKAAMDGKISIAGVNATYGNYVIISHSGGFQTMYAHLHTVSVKKGDIVSQNAQIGTVGSTGYSTGPHLHFAVFRNGRAVNPLDFLNARS